MFARTFSRLTSCIMLSNKLSRFEIIVLALIAVIFAIGFALVYMNVVSFEKYTREDGIVEWLTVLGLLLGSFTCFERAIRLRQSRHWLFLLTSVLFGIVLFFGAGEEISWGQRIFGIESPDYFKEKNLQGETNLHNLVVGGLKVNMWIFSFLLTAVLAIYIIVIPFLYRNKKWVQRFVRSWGIPLPKLYQIIAFICIFVLSQLIPHGKRAEILEAGTALMLFLMIRFPANPESFTADTDSID